MLDRLKFSWRAKLAGLLLIFSVTPLVFTAYWAIGTMSSAFQQASIRSLEALAAAKAEAIDQFTDVRRRDVERIANVLANDVLALREAIKAAEEASPKPEEPEKELPKLKDAEGAVKPDTDKEKEKEKPPPQEEPPPETKPVPEKVRLAAEAVKEAETKIRQTLGLVLRDQRDFEEVLVIDPRGHVIASTFQGHEGRSAEDIAYFINGLHATFVQPVFLSPVTEDLTMMIATPIRSPQMEVLGVLAARLNLKQFFQLINDTTGLGRTGETVVARKTGDQITLMAPTRHDAKAALNRTIAVGSQHAKSLQEAARGNGGSGRQTDYRGVETLAAWQYVPSLEWGLMVKMDVSEALQPVDQARRDIFIVTLVLVLLVVPAAFMAAGTLVRPLRELKEATDRISRGDFAVQLRIKSRDEIGELADSFERMVAAIKFFRERSRKVVDDPDEDEESVAPDAPV